MSPEEFDNRLRATFKDESLPPKEHMWANINARLDQKPNRPIWHWLMPAVVVFTASAVWLGSSLLNNNSNDTVVTNKTEVVTESTIASTPNQNSANAHAEKSTNENTDVTLSNDNSGIIKPNYSDFGKDKKSNNTLNGNTKPSNRETHNKPARKTTYFADNNEERSTTSSTNESIANNDIHNSKLNNDNNSSFNKNGISNTIYNAELETRNAQLARIKRFLHRFQFDYFNSSPLSENGLKLIQPTHRRQTASDMAWGGNFDDYKWWFNFGFGAQTNYNTFNAEYDDATKAKIHRHLIANQSKLTNNGNGFQAHIDIQRKFGKNNRLSFETGLNFSSRNEDIKINEQTYDIAARNSNDSISTYLKLKLFIAVGTDTTFFDATQSFAMVSKNKYSVYTIPLRFKYEQPINKNTFISLGVGGGVSYITAKSSNKYYNMVDEKSYTTSSLNKVSASFNSVLSIYTNYNGIGQFGIYAGYQTYLTPFTINNQYAVKMSDIQYGVTFRRPLGLE